MEFHDNLMGSMGNPIKSNENPLKSMGLSNEIQSKPMESYKNLMGFYKLIVLRGLGWGLIRRPLKKPSQLILTF